MSLSAHEQQALDAIEDGLAGAAPELTVLLATFTRLAAGEEMPAWERIRPAGRRAAEHIGRTVREGGQALRQRPGRKRTFLLLWLTVAISLITLAVLLNRSAGRTECSAPWPGVCAGQALARGVGLALPPGLARLPDRQRDRQPNPLSWHDRLVIIFTSCYDTKLSGVSRKECPDVFR